jgi:hypothetical protein
VIDHAAKFLASFGSVAGVLGKFSEGVEPTDERSNTKKSMVAKFPKAPREGVCYVSFNTAPSNKDMHGYVHAFPSPIVY